MPLAGKCQYLPTITMNFVQPSLRVSGTSGQDAGCPHQNLGAVSARLRRLGPVDSKVYVRRRPKPSEVRGVPDGQAESPPSGPLQSVRVFAPRPRLLHAAAESKAGLPPSTSFLPGATPPRPGHETPRRDLPLAGPQSRGRNVETPPTPDERGQRLQEGAGGSSVGRRAVGKSTGQTRAQTLRNLPRASPLASRQAR